MSADRDVTRVVRSWLHEDAYEDADRILNLVLDEIDTTPQRHASWLARRFPPMNNNLVRVALVAAVLVVAVIIGANLLQPSVGGPSPSEEPSVTLPEPAFLYNVPTGDLAAGRYELSLAIPARLTFTLPAGFNHDQGGIEAIHGTTAVNDGLEFQFASNVYPDPCHRATGAADPAVGASVDDLVTAMTSMVGFEAGPVTDLTIGGFPAKVFDLTNEIDASTCDEQDIRTFMWGAGDSPGSGSSVGSGERQRIYIVDVQGRRLMIMTYYFPNGDAAAEAAAAATLKAIVESIKVL